MRIAKRLVRPHQPPFLVDHPRHGGKRDEGGNEEEHEREYARDVIDPVGIRRERGHTRVLRTVHDEPFGLFWVVDLGLRVREPILEEIEEPIVGRRLVVQLIGQRIKPSLAAFLGDVRHLLHRSVDRFIVGKRTVELGTCAPRFHIRIGVGIAVIETALVHVEHLLHHTRAERAGVDRRR